MDVFTALSSVILSVMLFAQEVMLTVTQSQLKRIIAAAPANLPRTDALQQRIKIGVGFHNKWYRSQKEHWLGWIVFQELTARQKQREVSEILAKERWAGLNCIPMMFWLAETVGIDVQTLDLVEKVADAESLKKPCDCPQHGKAMRQVLPWEKIETALLTMPESVQAVADRAGMDAFERLASLRSKYRSLLVVRVEVQG